MTGFLKDVLSRTVAGLLILAIGALGAGLVVWWPDPHIRPWLLGAAYLILVSLITGTIFYRKAKRMAAADQTLDMDPPRALIACLLVLAWLSGAGISTAYVVKMGTTPENIAWIITADLAIVLLFKFAYAADKVLRDDDLRLFWFITIPFSCIGQAFLMVGPLLLIWGGVAIVDISTGTLTIDAIKDWLSQRIA